jgi:hypothetical protein
MNCESPGVRTVHCADGERHTTNTVLCGRRDCDGLPSTSYLKSSGWRPKEKFTAHLAIGIEPAVCLHIVAACLICQRSLS